MAARIKKAMNRIQAILAAINCTPASPNNPATSATINNESDHLNLVASFRCHYLYNPEGEEGCLLSLWNSAAWKKRLNYVAGLSFFRFGRRTNSPLQLEQT